MHIENDHALASGARRQWVAFGWGEAERLGFVERVGGRHLGARLGAIVDGNRVLVPQHLLLSEAVMDAAPEGEFVDARSEVGELWGVRVDLAGTVTAEEL